MIFFALMDYHFIMKIAPLVYIGMLVLLGVILIPGVGTSANNATRWLNLGFMQIQPSEFAKIGVIMVFASFFMANPGADQQGGYGRNRASSVRGSGSDDSGGAGSFDHVGDHVYFSVYDLRSKTKL